MKQILFIALTVCMLSSCVSSLYPISDNPDDYVFREELLGEWLSSDGNEWYRIERNSDEKRSNQYYISRLVTHSYPGDDVALDTTYYNAFLIRVDNEWFLDACPDMEQPAFHCKKTDLQSYLLPAHAICRVRFNGNQQITLGSIHIDSLKIFLAKKRSAPGHYNVSDDHLVLTAKPEVLQQKLLGNKKASFVFVEEEESVFNRVK